MHDTKGPCLSQPGNDTRKRHPETKICTVNLSWRSPGNESSPRGSAAFHGGVFRITMVPAFLRITQKVFIYELPSPWFLFIIHKLMRRRGRQAPPWKTALPNGFKRMSSAYWSNLLSCRPSKPSFAERTVETPAGGPTARNIHCNESQNRLT